MRKILETLENNGESVISDWGYYKQKEAKFDRKIHMLQQAEVDTRTGRVNLPQNLLAGPGVYKQKWIYKLKLHGDVQLRPMLCLGPKDRETEWTLLSRAIEKDSKLIPANAADIAEARRQEIINNRRDRSVLLDEEKK